MGGAICKKENADNSVVKLTTIVALHTFDCCVKLGGSEGEEISESGNTSV